MEDREQEKDMGMPNSMSNINPSQHESSSSHQEQRQLNSHQQVEKDPNSDPDPLNVAAAKTVQLRQPQSTTSIPYRECLKNHAVNMGGHVLDGCGEFMPTGKEGTPQALKCAACDCHRNFHRKETKAETQIARTIGPYSTFPTMQINKYFHGPVPAVMLNFRANKYIGSSADESSSEDLVNLFDREGQLVMQPSNFSISKKRFRTKFSQEQKEKMHEFAEKLGWRIQKEDEQQLQQFCNEVGVKRQVFKVWMHNSKQAKKKKSQA